VSVREDFEQAVNMTPKELEDWLATDESKQSGTGVGHDMGERIVEIKRTRVADLTEEDEADMRKVVGYVRRHLAQGGPDDDVEHSAWRSSLRNWGHDPLK
jgi:hypothetical protein